jgi:hypothetical protein
MNIPYRVRICAVIEYFSLEKYENNLQLAGVLTFKY